jgi:hypothetical protein
MTRMPGLALLRIQIDRDPRLGPVRTDIPEIRVSGKPEEGEDRQYQ